MSVTRGQCVARPSITFPAARHHRPLAGTKLYCFLTEAYVYIYTTYKRLHILGTCGNPGNPAALVGSLFPYRDVEIRVQGRSRSLKGIY